MNTLHYLGAAVLFSLFAFSGIVLTFFKVEETTQPDERKSIRKL